MSITASEARARLFPLIEEVNDEQISIEIISKRGRAFLVPEAEYRSMRETLYLLSSPANAERLRRGLKDAHSGKSSGHELLGE